eukprot:8081577-Ditylum_brightwellii.AAC.1
MYRQRIGTAKRHWTLSLGKPLHLTPSTYREPTLAALTVILGHAMTNLQYILTTTFGEAPFSNWHNFIVAIFGIGQGATDGPTGWLFISNIILKCYS